MKHFAFLLFFAIFSWTTLSADVHRGYVLTLDGEKLTGQIGSIQHYKSGSQVLFINDFGTPYTFRAEAIRGFGFLDGNQKVVYESKSENGYYFFLQVIKKGEKLSLYCSPVEYVTLRRDDFGFTYEKKHQSKEFWISQEGHSRATRLKAFRFRHKMRKLIGDYAPELAEKIGQKDYRFKDLPRIIEELNEMIRRKKYKL